MTTDIATRRAANGAVAIPHALPMPPVPEPVAAHMRHAELHAEARAAFAAASPEERETMFVGSAPALPVLTGQVRRDAEIAEAALARETSPVTAAMFRAWLGPVNAAVRNPQPQADFEVRCMGLFTLLDDLPAGAFTAEARRALPAFFPSAEDIRKAVEPGARRLRATLATLRDALAAKPQQDAQQPVREPQHVRDAMAEQARLLAAELRAAGAEREAAGRQPARAVHLSDGALLARYERLASEGNFAAAARAAALRARLGA